MSSPTQRSLAEMRGRGCQLVAVTEHWNPFAHIRQDLFGILDLVCVKDGKTIGVQTTSGSKVAARRDKMESSQAIAPLREAGWILLIHGWRKVKVKRGGKAMTWELRELDISRPPEQNSLSTEQTSQPQPA